MTMPKLMQLAKDNAARKNILRAEASSADEVTIYIDGVIGDWFGDIGNQELKAALAGTSAKVVHLRVNTPGGDVFEARAMMTTLAQYRTDNGSKIVGHADALVASAGTFFLMVCDEIEMSQGGFFMIHKAWTIAMGNEKDFLTTAGLLGKIDETIVNDYMSRVTAGRDEVVAWMDAETWLTADEAKQYGFIDTVVELTTKKNSAKASAWNLSAYANAPKALTNPAPPDDSAAALAAHHSHLGRRLALLEAQPA